MRPFHVKYTKRPLYPSRLSRLATIRTWGTLISRRMQPTRFTPGHSIYCVVSFDPIGKNSLGKLETRIRDTRTSGRASSCPWGAVFWVHVSWLPFSALPASPYHHSTYVQKRTSFENNADTVPVLDDLLASGHWLLPLFCQPLKLFNLDSPVFPL